MSKRSPIPSYRLHKHSGQAVVTLLDWTGRRRDVPLGRYDTPASRADGPGRPGRGISEAGAALPGMAGGTRPCVRHPVGGQ
jgi:hypothetical protein